jgi:hypothetical protein
MVRILVAVLIFASVLGVTIFTEAPAKPYFTTCDQALMGYAAAVYALDNCDATLIYHCDNEIEALANAMDAVTIFCGIDEMPY